MAPREYVTHAPLKILMFGWEFPPHNSGGLGTACQGLTRALVRQGAVVTFVLPKRFDLSETDTTFAYADDFFPELSVRLVDSLLSPYLTSRDYESLRTGKSAQQYGLSLIQEVKLYSLRAGALAAHTDFDVIHAHDWLSFGAGIEAKRISGKPLFVHVHATEFDRSGGTGVNPDVYALERQGMEAADSVIAVSEYTRRIIIDKYGILPEKVSVVHNGIDPIDIPVSASVSTIDALKKSGKKIVLFAGRITLQKGPDYFLRAARRVLDFYPDVLFVIAGSGDMERQIIRQASELGISDRVIFSGFLRGEELSSVYRSADLYVMPSVSEPFGLTVLEAIQQGTPVLVSRQSGVSEVVHHAVRVDFWDIDEMANKIITILYHPSLRETMRRNSVQELPKISWHAAAEKCLHMYKKLTTLFKVQ